MEAAYPYGRRVRVNSFTLILLAVLALSGCGLRGDAIIVSTQDGPLRGIVENATANFLGIPYAAPPVGALRWRPPQPPSTWQTVRNATKRGSSCPQFAPFFDRMLGDEDCLTLNVWAPHPLPREPAPVMVWIHGGGFTAGQGAYQERDGQKLARRTGNIVVSLNYRLGVFGFLAHEALAVEDPAHPSSGNYGIEDQTAALRWVRANIAAFGGDPDKVTIFGQSAGGVSVCAQLVSPLSKGLFQRAIVQSGPCTSRLSTLSAISHQVGDRLTSLLGCNDSPDVLACMREKPADEVAKQLPPDPSFAFGEGYTVWWPVLDDYVLTEQMGESFRTGHFNRVPVMIGATKEEGTLIVMLSHDLLFKRLKPEQYPERIRYLVGSDDATEKVLARYPLREGVDPEVVLSEAFSDGFFNCLTRNIAISLAEHVPTYVYEFDYQDAPFFLPSHLPLRAFHSAEVQYVFGNPFSLIHHTFKGEDEKLSHSMMDTWARFAKTGNPNGDGMPHWPAYDSTDRHLIFDTSISVSTSARKEACAFWNELDYLRAPYQD